MNELTLSLLFLRRKDQILLAMKKRGFGEGKWNGVGGKLDPGESVEEAMRRETQEEIGVTPTKYERVGLIDFTEYFKGEPARMIVHVFVATDWEGEPHETEEMRPEWFSVDSIPYETMWPDDPHWLPAVVDGQKIIASFTLNKEDVITDLAVHTVEELPHEL